MKKKLSLRVIIPAAVVLVLLGTMGQYCYPGDGSGDVRAIMIDLLKTGYDGGFSIEPHVANVFHDADLPAP